MHRLFAAALVAVSAVTFVSGAAEARRAWYGPGSGPSPYPQYQQRPGVVPPVRSGYNPYPVIQPVPAVQRCVAGSRCFNGYLDGHIPIGQGNVVAPRPQFARCVPGVGLVGLNGLCVR